MNWIAVNDRLPESAKKVLAVMGGETRKVMMVASNLEGKWLLGWTMDEIPEHHRHISHWMPLPDPPKENK